ncbi:insulinase family protein [Candidatus Uhrbacteria bacterium]|nr:insulinase family protein [Candidatus Uhrbacteria bacterium]
MFERFKLTNGVRTVLVPHADTKAITLLSLFRVGSRFERASTLGLSHFLEHMMFKGTRKHPETVEISRILDSLGAEYNAFTGKDHTGYYIKVNYEHAALALDIMFDMLAHSLLKPEEIERERKVIQEEINMYEDNPIMLVEELFEEELFRGNSLGWRIAGQAATLARIKRKELTDFRRKFYRPSEIVVVAAGRLPTIIQKNIARTFGSLRPQRGRPTQPRSFRVLGRHRAGPRVVVKFKDTGQVQVALGFPALALSHPRLPTLQVLSTILGGTMSSRLFIAVRERRGLAYSIRSSISGYEDTGNLMIQAGLDKARLDEALRVMMAELRRMRERGVTKEELASAKENIRGRMTLALEDSEMTADFYGKQELHLGKIATPDEKLAKILAVTKEEVAAVAAAICQPSLLAAAVIGPFEDAGRFVKLLQ